MKETFITVKGSNQMIRNRFGYRPDLDDRRDFKFRATRVQPTRIPTKVDLRPKMPPIQDQGQTGTCVANALATALEFLELKVGETFVDKSRLFIYYYGHIEEGIPVVDDGMYIRLGIKALADYGCCGESMWPFDPAMIPVKPTDECCADALNHQIISYSRLNNIRDVKACLANGFPLVAGLELFPSFDLPVVYDTGVVPMPGRQEAANGLHAIVICGYDDKAGRVTCQNSWGTEWGDHGFFTVPYTYITKYAWDMWDIQKEEVNAPPHRR